MKETLSSEQRAAKSHSRVPKLEALVNHLRHCRDCAELDVMKCPEGKALWVTAAMPLGGLQPFADGRLGCPECGNYADLKGLVQHATDCSRNTP
jgi:hypothetical protein